MPEVPRVVGKCQKCQGSGGSFRSARDEGEVPKDALFFSSSEIENTATKNLTVNGILLGYTNVQVRKHYIVRRFDVSAPHIFHF